MIGIASTRKFGLISELADSCRGEDASVARSINVRPTASGSYRLDASFRFHQGDGSPLCTGSLGHRGYGRPVRAISS